MATPETRTLLHGLARILLVFSASLASCTCRPDRITDIQYADTVTVTYRYDDPVFSGFESAEDPQIYRVLEDLRVGGRVRLATQSVDFRIYRIVRRGHRTGRWIFENDDCKRVTYASDHDSGGLTTLGGYPLEQGFRWSMAGESARARIESARADEAREAEPVPPPPGSSVYWFCDDAALIQAGAPTKGRVPVAPDGTFEIELAAGLLESVRDVLRSRDSLRLQLTLRGPGLETRAEDELALTVPRPLIDDVLQRRAAISDGSR